MAAASGVGGMLKGHMKLKLYGWPFWEAMDGSFWGMEADAWAVTDGLCMGPGLAMGWGAQVSTRQRREVPAKEYWSSEDFLHIVGHCAIRGSLLYPLSIRLRQTLAKSIVFLQPVYFEEAKPANFFPESQLIVGSFWSSCGLGHRLNHDWPFGTNVFEFVTCYQVKRWKQSMEKGTIPEISLRFLTVAPISTEVWRLHWLPLSDI